MNFEISWSINVDGVWWDVTSQHNVSDGKTTADKMKLIEATIRGVAKAGRVIPRAGVIATELDGPIESPPAAPGGKATSPANGWPAPHCETHADGMSASSIQKDPKHKMFYCPKRLGEGYCPKRAKVNNETGMPKFYEVT